MKDLFIMGGPFFMGILTILLIITITWIVYHFSVIYNSSKTDISSGLRKLGYGKLIGLFALMIGILGQMVGFTAMFDAIEQIVAKGDEIKAFMVYGGIKVTMIVTMYGIIIYLLSLALWFVATLMIEKKRQQYN